MTNEPTEHDSADHWEANAARWIAWVREPNHDAYWYYRDAFRAFVPSPGRSTLEIGCGEGRISRDLTKLGHRVTATDITPALVAATQAAGSADRYVVADAAALPFDNDEFDRVVAYNVFMDVPDMPAAIAEAARVLDPAGSLTLSIVHPFMDRGAFVDDSPDAAFQIEGTYYGRQHFAGTESRAGHVMHFAGWSHPLQDYAAALETVGLAITAIREPRPQIPAQAGTSLHQWRRFPLFLWVNATPLT